MLFIYLFGQPRLIFDSLALKLNAPPKTIPLLAYLLLHRHQTLERQQIAFTLWPNDPEPTSRANLRRHLHWLGRVLPPSTAVPWLHTTPTTLQWNPASNFWLDVAEFETFVTSPTTLSAAIALYSGNLYDNLYDDWIFFPRERLRTLYLHALSQLVAQQRAQCNYSAATGYAQQILTHDPFREDILRQLISLHYEAGDRAGAIAEYNRFAKQLYREMGIAPMPETQALYEIVLRQGRLPGQGRGESPPCLPEPDSRPPALPFVGRQSEMTRLMARWQQTTQGNGGLLLISGAAGVGKTRLVREMARLVECQGGRVLYGTNSLRENSSYQAIVEAFQAALPLLASLDRAATWLAALSPLLPDLRLRRPLPTLPVIQPEQERVRLFEAIVGCLEKLSEPRPLLLILEDLHWAGESTLSLLEFVVRRLTQQPVLIVGTYREEEVSRSHPLRALRRRWQAEKRVEVQPLRQLGVTAVADLLAQLPSSKPELALPLHVASEGNALFLSLFWQQWQETNTRGRETAVPPDNLPLPAGIRAVIEQRLATLSPTSRAYADVAAIFGPAFDPEAVREVGGWSESQALDALDELLDRQLAHDAAHIREYHFAHHLIQSTLYAAIPPARRKKRHRRAAEVLESLYTEPAGDQSLTLAGDLAYHYDQGGAFDRAIPHYLAAAQNHLTVYADAESLTALQRGLALADTSPGIAPQLIFDLLSRQELIYQRQGNQAARHTCLTRMAQLLPDLHDAQRECAYWQRQMKYDNSMNDYAGHLGHIVSFRAAAATAAAATGSPYWQAEVMLAEAIYYKRMNEHETAVTHLQQALSLYQQIPHLAGQIDCYCQLAELHIINRHSADAETWTQKALALCPPDQPTPQLLNTLWNIAANSLLSKELPRCLHHATQLLAAAERGGDRFWQAAAHRLMGMAYQHQFQVAQARHSLDTALSIYQHIQHHKGQALTWQTLGHLETSLGQYATGKRHYQRTLAICEQQQDLDGMASECINLAYTLSMQQDYAGEREYAHRALTYARQVANQHLEGVALQNLGEAERELGHLDTARQHLTAALALLSDPTLFLERASILNDLALTYWKANDLPLAQQTTAELLALYPQIDGKDDNTHRFLWTAGQICRATGQQEAAAHWLAQAYAAFQTSLAAIPDASSRHAFAQIHHNRQIVAAYEQDKW